VAITILKIPSKIPDHQPGYRGPIIFNWGNPGTSGVRQSANSIHMNPDVVKISLMNVEGLLLQSTLGDGYDLISFDPRYAHLQMPM
jgi:hypothetical protein